MFRLQISMQLVADWYGKETDTLVLAFDLRCATDWEVVITDTENEVSRNCKGSTDSHVVLLCV